MKKKGVYTPVTTLFFLFAPLFQVRYIYLFIHLTRYNHIQTSHKMVLVKDLLNPNPATEAQQHKLKTLVQSPRSFFMDVRCPGCLQITTVFSHAQTAVTCDSCTNVLCSPTGGKTKLTDGCAFRRK